MIDLIPEKKLDEISFIFADNVRIFSIYHVCLLRLIVCLYCVASIQLDFLISK